MSVFCKVAKILPLLVLACAVSSGWSARAESVLRIAMTATDVPTTTGMPNNGSEGMRFLGYPVFESFVQWDLSRADVLADIVPALAESWEQDPEDKTRWTFHLRREVKFHDGSDFNADAVIWNMERFFNPGSPQFETQGAAIVQGRVRDIESWRKIDSYTVEIVTKKPVSWLLYSISNIMFASPAQFDKLGSWAAVAEAPSGTGPFKITNFVPRTKAELERFDGYWDQDRMAKVDRIILFPMPEATTRLAALRSGQVDWIEVPPPDTLPGLDAAGFNVVTNSYPHIWPWLFNLAKEDSPWKDVRVRRAANYCVDRDGLVALLNGAAEPAYGFFKKGGPKFGNPENQYGYDPDKARALLQEAGHGPDSPVKAKIMISTSGSGQMLPVPMNEFLQQQMRECWFDISFEVVEWGTMLVAFRNSPTGPQALDSDGLNISLITSDISMLPRYLHGSVSSPNGSNWANWKNPDFDATIDKMGVSTDPEEIKALTRRANEIIVDDAPWLYIVHDLNPRAMSPKVKGFVSAQSWFQDLTSVYIEE